MSATNEMFNVFLLTTPTGIFIHALLKDKSCDVHLDAL
jgi:hypothetical protein